MVQSNAGSLYVENFRKVAHVHHIHPTAVRNQIKLAGHVGIKHERLRSVVLD